MIELLVLFLICWIIFSDYVLPKEIKMVFLMVCQRIVMADCLAGKYNFRYFIHKAMDSARGWIVNAESENPALNKSPDRDWAKCCYTQARKGNRRRFFLYYNLYQSAA